MPVPALSSEAFAKIVPPSRADISSHRRLIDKSAAKGLTLIHRLRVRNAQ
jgi:hypothetical protein